MAQMITFEREVSIGSPEHGKGPQIKQGDSGITFRVALSVCKPVTQWLGRSEAYPIPAGATAVMRVKKPDGTYTITDAAVDGINTVIAPLPAEATTSAGECKAEVSLYDTDGHRLTSATFAFEVAPQVVDETSEPAKSYIDILGAEIKELHAAVVEANKIREDAAAGKFDGATPYIGTNGNWWINGADTGVYAGGDAPYIGDNGSWYVGNRDTGVMATGPQGDTGKDGYSPTVATQAISNGTRVTITDASGVNTFDVLNGAEGPQGEQGEPGETGPQGDPGPQGEPGIGIPEGGTPGQVIVKTETGTAWADMQGGGGGTQVQADYEQTDANDPSYIQNRPFYSGFIGDFSRSFEAVLSSFGTYDYSEEVTEQEIFEGDTYRVTFDNEVYMCSPIDQSGMLIIGNLSLGGMGDDTGEPFILGYEWDSEYNEGRLHISTKTSGMHTIKVESKTVIKQLDTKYIPALKYVRAQELRHLNYNQSEVLQLINDFQNGDTILLWNGYLVVDISIGQGEPPNVYLKVCTRDYFFGEIVCKPNHAGRYFNSYYYQDYTESRRLLPNYDGSADEGKVLKIVDGRAQWVTP